MVRQGARHDPFPPSDGNGLISALRNLPPIVKLIISIIIDLVGFLSYLLPGLGETPDVAWAPVSASIIYALYGSAFYAVLGFAEEIFPGTDIIPTACLAWIYDLYKRRRALARQRQDEGYNPR